MSQTYYTTEDVEDAKKYKDAYVDYIKQFTTYYRSQYDNVNPSDADIDTMANKVHDNIIKYSLYCTGYRFVMFRFTNSRSKWL